MYWACGQLAPRREAVAQRFLEVNGYQVYVPRLRERRIRSGRRLEVLAPLFPSYAFIAIENGWHCARWSIGVVGLIMAGERPAVVADRIIDEIRQREVSGAVELPTPELRRGDAVRVLRGPFRELEGLFAGQAPHERVAILLSLLGGHQRVTLPRADVEAIG
jgi:transcriptional antiterminator RfaH